MAVTDIGGFLQQDSVTILNGQSQPAAGYDLANRTLMGLELPAAWTAAGLSFQASRDNATWRDLFTINGEYAFPSSSGGQFLAVDPNYFLGVRYLKIRSGTTGAPVAQGADRVVNLVFRQVQT